MNPQALEAATRSVRGLLAQVKNPRTPLGRHSSPAVAFHVAHEAVRVYLAELDRQRLANSG